MAVPGAYDKIVAEVSSWEGVSASPHRFGGMEFRMGRREIGHVHRNYQADIPFPKPVRDILVSEGRAQPHHILPESGWITFRLVKSEDVGKAIELFRMSYDISRSKMIGTKPLES
jgi:hypothetical protein